MEDSEINRLKTKINMQIDRMTELDKENSQLKDECETLKNENLKLRGELETVSKKIRIFEDSARAEAHATNVNKDILEFYTIFFEIVKKIHKKGEFIPYKNTTKYSASYCKVERSVFEGYIKDFVNEKCPEFIDMCCKFLCIKSETDGKCVFNNDKIRVYFINRQLVNAILEIGAGVAEPDAAKVV